MSAYYNEMAAEYPRLAPYFLDVTQGVIYGAFGAYIGGPVGLAGALVLVVEQKAAAAVVDAVAGEKIKAVMEAGIEKTAEGLRKFDVELSYEDSIYLALGIVAGGALVLGLKGEAKSLLGAAEGGVDKILHSTKNIIGGIKHKADVKVPETNKINGGRGVTKKVDSSAVDNKIHKDGKQIVFSHEQYTTRDNLNRNEFSNLQRFEKKLPSSRETLIVEFPDGTKTFRAEVAGNVPGSKAIYEKTINSNGATIKYIKTTYAPDGSVIYIKDKFNTKRE